MFAEQELRDRLSRLEVAHAHRVRHADGMDACAEQLSDPNAEEVVLRERTRYELRSQPCESHALGRRASELMRERMSERIGEQASQWARETPANRESESVSEGE